MSAGDVLFELWIPRLGLDWLTSNTVKGRHWGSVSADRKKWAANTRAAMAYNPEQRGPLAPAILHTELRFSFERTRDPLNFADTLKPIVDHLIKEWHLWPDDNPIYLEQLAPTISVHKREKAWDGVKLRAVARE